MGKITEGMDRVFDDGCLWCSLVALDEVSQHNVAVAVGAELPGMTSEDVKVEVIGFNRRDNMPRFTPWAGARTEAWIVAD